MSQSSKPNQPPKDEPSLMDLIMDNTVRYASQPIECEICHIFCYGSTPYQQHLKGASHKKKAARQIAAAATEISTAAREMTAAATKMAAAGGSGWSCKICQKEFNGPNPYKQHMEGIQHQKKVKRQADNLHT